MKQGTHVKNTGIFLYLYQEQLYLYNNIQLKSSIALSTEKYVQCIYNQNLIILFWIFPELRSLYYKIVEIEKSLFNDI